MGTPLADSTIAPPLLKNPAMFFDEIFMSPRRKEGRNGNNVFVYVSACRGLSNGDVRVAGVIRLSWGKLLVNLLQVVKRTNTPLSSLTNGVVDGPWFFWVVG